MTKAMSRKILGWMALALVCVMAGALLGSARVPAQAETVVVTSPFTEAIAQVHDSVVGVNNYQIMNTYGYGSNGGYGSYGGFPWDFFGYGNGYPYGYGNGNGNDQGGEEVHYGSGSGVVVAEGYVLTNYHVVEDAHSLKVSVNNEATGEAELYDAAVAASDPEVDVAVLYVPELKLAPVELGDSDTLQIGDWAILIGNPLGFTGTVTTGIVSGLDRDVKSDKTSVDKYGRRSNVVNQMIQTDAAINSGISGGGMFNTQGQLMGIPTLKYSGTRGSGAMIENVGMCIPINDAKPVIEEALKADTSGIAASAEDPGKDPAPVETEKDDLKGKPRMGVTVTTLNVTNGQLPNGAYIISVDAGSPAEQAGLQPGDIIVEANDQVISTVSDMTGMVAGMKEGDQIRLKVFRPDIVEDVENVRVSRSGEYVDLTLTLAIVDAIAQ